MLFKAAPIGDPKRKVLLTVQASPSGRADLLVAVHKDEDVLFDFEIPYDALILSGLPSQGLTDANAMVALLDRAAAALPEWTKGRRKWIHDAPVKA